MSRLLELDFKRLELFLNDYSLADTLKSTARHQLIRRGHKYSLAALQMWVVVDKFAHANNLTLNTLVLAPTTLQFEQLSESFSDLISAYFAALHGIYKPAHMSLRSSIETFTRGLSGLSSNEAATTTRVHRLFELARGCDPFLGPAQKHFDQIHQEYASLCDYTHTATSAHMVRNHAMSNFPKQDVENMRIWIRHFEKTIKCMLAILVVSNPALYLRAPSAVRDLYDDTLPKDARLFALGGT